MDLRNVVSITIHDKEVDKLYFDRDLVWQRQGVQPQPIPDISHIEIEGNTRITEPGLYTMNLVVYPAAAVLTKTVWSIDNPNSNIWIEYINNRTAYLHVGEDVDRTIEVKCVVEGRGKQATHNVVIATGEEPPIPEPIYVDSISISGPNSIDAPGTYDFYAVYNPSNANEYNFNWSFVGSFSEPHLSLNVDPSNPLHARLVVAEASSSFSAAFAIECEDTVSHKYNRYSVAVDVYVQPVIPDITSITVSGPSSITEIGDYDFYATIYPAGASADNLRWTGSSEGYAINFEVDSSNPKHCILHVVDYVEYNNYQLYCINDDPYVYGYKQFNIEAKRPEPVITHVTNLSRKSGFGGTVYLDEGGIIEGEIYVRPVGADVSEIVLDTYPGPADGPYFTKLVSDSNYADLYKCQIILTGEDKSAYQPVDPVYEPNQYYYPGNLSAPHSSSSIDITVGVENTRNAQPIDPDPIEPETVSYRFGEWWYPAFEYIWTMEGNRVWSDGSYLYYSSGSTQLVFNKENKEWQSTSFSGMTSFNGGFPIWSDGVDVYYSSGTTQYVLNKETRTWSTKTWNGATSFGGQHVWTDGENIYLSLTRKLNVATSTWESVSFSGLSSATVGEIWTDGENVYYSNNSTQYVLDKETRTWSRKTWNGLTSFLGSYIWTDGWDTYYTNGSAQYVLDKSTSTWSRKTWERVDESWPYPFNGVGYNVYCSDPRFKTRSNCYSTANKRLRSDIDIVTHDIDIYYPSSYKTSKLGKVELPEPIVPDVPEPDTLIGVDLNSQWVESTYNAPSDMPSNYRMYMSNSNHNVNNGVATMYINVGATYAGDLIIFINSYAESDYDYTSAYVLDSTSSILTDTKGFQWNPSVSLSNYKAVKYVIPDDNAPHRIKITYKKDISVDKDYDRGFVLVPIDDNVPDIPDVPDVPPPFEGWELESGNIESFTQCQIVLRCENMNQHDISFVRAGSNEVYLEASSYSDVLYDNRLTLDIYSWNCGNNPDDYIHGVLEIATMVDGSLEYVDVPFNITDGSMPWDL